MDIQLSLGVKKRLDSAECKDRCVGWLLGWHMDNCISCVGCLTSKDLMPDNMVQNLQNLLQPLPIGLEVIGIFFQSKNTIKEEESIEFCQQLHISGLKELEETTEFCVIIQDNSNFRGFVYDSSSNNMLPVSITVVETSTVLADTVALRLQGKLPFNLELSGNSAKGDSDSMYKVIDSLRNQVLSPVFAIHLTNSLVLLQNLPEFHSSTDGLTEDLVCSDLYNFLEEEDDGFGIQKKSKKKSKFDLECLNFKLLFQTTGDEAIKRTLSCLPIVHYIRKEFVHQSLTIPVDVVAVVPGSFPISRITQTLVNGVCRQLDAIKTCLNNFKQESNYPIVNVFHFRPETCDHFVSVVYPQNIPEENLEIHRQLLHHNLMLPQDRPLFRKVNRYLFPNEDVHSPYLQNVHVGLSLPGGNETSVGLIQGIYSYHHYMQDHFDDNGWGCAYRSLQTIISWFRHQGYTNEAVPSHNEIQQALVDIGDKPPNFVGSKKWIGSVEVGYCLNKLIGVSSKLMNVSSGADLSSKGRELLTHFKTQGTPVMIGGGVLAHTIIGISFNEKSGDVKFLILDPHYTGTEDLSVIQGKGWCGWKNADFWDKNSYYNLCLPLRPIFI